MGISERFRGAYFGAMIGDLIGAVWPQLEQRHLKGLITASFPPSETSGGWGRQTLAICAALTDWQDIASMAIEGVKPFTEQPPFDRDLARALCCGLPIMLFFHDVPAEQSQHLTALTHRLVPDPTHQAAVQTYLMLVSDRLTQALQQAVPCPLRPRPIVAQRASGSPAIGRTISQAKALKAQSTDNSAIPSTIAPLLEIVNSVILPPTSPSLALVRSLQLYDQLNEQTAPSPSHTSPTSHYPEHYRTLGMTIGATMGATHGLSGWPIAWQQTLMQRLRPLLEVEWGIPSGATLVPLVNQLAIAWSGGQTTADTIDAIAAAQVLQPR